MVEYLTILETICNNIDDTIINGSVKYLYSSAVYDTWCNGTDLDKNLAKHLVLKWEQLFEALLSKRRKYKLN